MNYNRKIMQEIENVMNYNRKIMQERGISYVVFSELGIWGLRFCDAVQKVHDILTIK